MTSSITPSVTIEYTDIVYDESQYEPVSQFAGLEQKKPFLYYLPHMTVLPVNDLLKCLRAIGLPEKFDVHCDAMGGVWKLIGTHWRLSEAALQYLKYCLEGKGMTPLLNMIWMSVLGCQPFEFESDSRVMGYYNTLWYLFYGGFPTSGECDTVVGGDLWATNESIGVMPMATIKKDIPSYKLPHRTWIMFQGDKVGTHSNPVSDLIGCYPCWVHEDATREYFDEQVKMTLDWCVQKKLPLMLFTPPLLPMSERRFLTRVAIGRGICLMVPDQTISEPHYCQHRAREFAEEFPPWSPVKLVCKQGRDWVNYKKHKAPLLICMTLWMLLDVCSAQCVKINDKLVCNLGDYVQYFGHNHSIEGPYRVCFDTACFLRYRNGTEHITNPYGIHGIWPYKCPSYDWEPNLTKDYHYHQCKQCGGTVHGSVCVHSQVKRSYSQVRTIYPTPGGIAISEQGAWFKGRSRPGTFRMVSYSLSIPERHPGPIDVHLKCKSLWLLVVLLTLDVVVVFCALFFYLFKKDLKYTEAHDIELSADIDYDTLEVKPKQVRMVPNWFFACLLVVLLIELPVLVMADIDLTTMSDLPPSNVSTFSLPSACSCTDAGTIVSQLSCNIPCSGTIDINDIHMVADFVLAEVCIPRSLYRLTYLEELVVRGCDWGGTKEPAARLCMSADYCEHLESHAAGYGMYDNTGCAGYCALGWDTYRLARWSFTEIEGEWCRWVPRSDGGIWGVPEGVNYTASVDTKFAKDEGFRWFNGNRMYIVSTLNGHVAGENWWMGDKGQIQDGKPISGSPLLDNVKEKLILTKEDCLWPTTKPLTWYDHGIPGWFMLPVTQSCHVRLQFSNMRCYEADQLHTANYTVIAGQTMLIAPSDGMIGGWYVAKGDVVRMPDTWKLCENCTASDSDCSTNSEPSDECILRDINDTMSTPDYTTKFEPSVSSNNWSNWLTYVVWCLVGIGIIILTGIVIKLVCCLIH